MPGAAVRWSNISQWLPNSHGNLIFFQLRSAEHQAAVVSCSISAAFVLTELSNMLVILFIRCFRLILQLLLADLFSFCQLVIKQLLPEYPIQLKFICSPAFIPYFLCVALCLISRDLVFLCVVVSYDLKKKRCISSNLLHFLRLMLSRVFIVLGGPSRQIKIKNGGCEDEFWKQQRDRGVLQAHQLLLSGRYWRLGQLLQAGTVPSLLEFLLGFLWKTKRKR